MAPKWGRMYLISPFFSRAFLFFSLISWYDNLRVPTNLGGRVDAQKSKKSLSQNIQFECFSSRRLVTARGHSRLQLQAPFFVLADIEQILFFRN